MFVCVKSSTRLVTQQVQDAVARAETTAIARSVTAARPLRVQPGLGVCQLPLQSSIPAPRLSGRQQVTNMHQENMARTMTLNRGKMLLYRRNKGLERTVSALFSAPTHCASV